MTYATRDDMIKAFGEDELIELTDRAETGAIDDEILAAALVSACSEIDGYVGRVAELPLTVVVPQLRQLALTIARYRLSTDQGEGRARLDYEDAVRILERIAQGMIKLDLPAEDEAAVVTHRVRGRSAPATFTGKRLGSDWP
jgi:phage gp36-like protein